MIRQRLRRAGARHVTHRVFDRRIGRRRDDEPGIDIRICRHDPHRAMDGGWSAPWPRLGRQGRCGRASGRSIQPVAIRSPRRHDEPALRRLRPGSGTRERLRRDRRRRVGCRSRVLRQGPRCGRHAQSPGPDDTCDDACPPARHVSSLRYRVQPRAIRACHNGTIESRRATTRIRRPDRPKGRRASGNPPQGSGEFRGSGAAPRPDGLATPVDAARSGG